MSYRKSRLSKRTHPVKRGKGSGQSRNKPKTKRMAVESKARLSGAAEGAVLGNEEAAKVAHPRVDDLIRQAKEQLEQLNKHLTEVRENERASVARELHDQLGQSLIALKMDLKWAHDNVDHVGAVTQKLHDMLDMVTSTIKDVQRISAELRPSILDDLGLASAIDWYGEEFAKRAGTKCSMDLEEVQCQNPHANLALYRVLQEALTNVIRHAQAMNVAVKLWRSKDNICLEIVDDGIGIGPEKPNSSRSLGLLGMAERMAQFNGSIEIASAKIKGTVVRVSIPINE
ncbi:MAG: sensor histidine kinase [Bacteroidota bacterium]